MLTSTPARLLSVEGAYNLRDIGGYAAATGYATRWRVLLRSGSLHALAPKGHVALAELGLRSLIDLRTSHEIAAEPNPFAHDPQVRYLHLPLIDALSSERGEQQAPSLQDVYRYILDQRRTALGQVFVHLAEPDALPALVHCTAGKDRTGLVVALLLSIAGVPKHMIAADFALSEPALAVAPAFSHHREQLVNSGRGHLLSAPPELITESLNYLEEQHGSIAAYLHTCGLSEPILHTLRAALLDHVVDRQQERVGLKH